MKVGIIMGSSSDQEIAKKVAVTLNKFDVEYDVEVISAHRTPQKALDFATHAKQNGYGVIIAIAGMAAHLGGVLAALTTLPVIGIPVKSSMMGGLDALLSMVQMPKNVPVATVAINGGENAAILAVQMMALSDEVLAKKLEQFKADLVKDVDAMNEEVAKYREEWD